MATSTPVASKRSNGPLAPSSDHRQIRQLISSALEKCSLIDEKIADFQATLDDLCLQRQALDHYIQEHLAMIASIRQLPTELIQTIFRYCLPARNVVMRSDEAPLLLGRVCSMWRQIAYTTPQLWSSLHVCLPRIEGPHLLVDYLLAGDPVFQKMAQYGEAIAAWLCRASNTPLSISFSMKNHRRGTWERDEACNQILDVLVRFSLHWKKFTFSDAPNYITSDASESLAFQALSETDFPLLETVVLDDDRLVARSSLLHAPSLRSISIVRFSMLDYTWAQITHLALGSWGFRSVFSPIPSIWALGVLRSCHKLISCILVIQVETVPLDMDRVHLPSLEVLRIRLFINLWDAGDTNDGALGFFSRIEAPKLAHFGFKSNHNKLLSVPFLSLFAQPNVVEAVEYEDRDILHSLTDAFALSPSIRRLCVIAEGLQLGEDQSMFINHESFLTRLALKPNHLSPICPCLDEIEIELPVDSDLSDQILLEFLLSRTDRAPPGAKRLRRARVVFQRHRSIDILPDLSHAIERGLQVEIIYRPPEFTVTYLPLSELHLAEDSTFECNREFLAST